MEPTKEDIQKWVNALRSGQFTQTHKGDLQNYEGYCCLGVACEVFVGDVYRRHAGFLTGGHPYVCKGAPFWLEEINNVFYKKTGLKLTTLNDSGDTLIGERDREKLEAFTFDEIADLLELVYIHEILNERDEGN